jgi:hypothetical protein
VRLLILLSLPKEIILLRPNGKDAFGLYLTETIQNNQVIRNKRIIWRSVFGNTVCAIKKIFANVYDIRSSSAPYFMLTYQILILLMDNCRNYIFGLSEKGVGIVTAIQETEGRM